MQEEVEMKNCAKDKYKIEIEVEESALMEDLEMTR